MPYIHKFGKTSPFDSFYTNVPDKNKVIDYIKFYFISVTYLQDSVYKLCMYDAYDFTYLMISVGMYMYESYKSMPPRLSLSLLQIHGAFHLNLTTFHIPVYFSTLIWELQTSSPVISSSSHLAMPS